VTPEAFAAQIGEWGRGTMIAGRGTRFVSAGEGRAGAIIALADETATAAAMGEIDPTGEFRPELFPLTRQMSAKVIRNTNQGPLVAEAEIVHRGRTTMPAERPGP